MTHFASLQVQKPEMYFMCRKIEQYFYAEQHELTCIYSGKLCKYIVDDLGKGTTGFFPYLSEKIEHLAMGEELRNKLFFLNEAGEKCCNNIPISSEDARKCYQYIKDICKICYPPIQSQNTEFPIGTFLFGLLLGTFATVGAIHTAQNIQKAR